MDFHSLTGWNSFSSCVEWKKSIKCWPQTPRTLQAPVCLSPGCHIRYLPWIHYLMLVSTHVRTEPKHSLRGSKCALLISKIKRYFRQTEWTKSKRGNTDDRAWTLSTQDAFWRGTHTTDSGGNQKELLVIFWPRSGYESFWPKGHRQDVKDAGFIVTRRWV